MNADSLPSRSLGKAGRCDQTRKGNRRPENGTGRSKVICVPPLNVATWNRRKITAVTSPSRR